MSAIRSFRTLQRNCIRLHFLCMDRFLSSLSSAMETHSRLKRKENQINGFYSSLLIFSFNFFAVFVLTSILISMAKRTREGERERQRQSEKSVETLQRTELEKSKFSRYAIDESKHHKTSLAIQIVYSNQVFKYVFLTNWQLSTLGFITWMSCSQPLFLFILFAIFIFAMCFFHFRLHSLFYWGGWQKIVHTSDTIPSSAIHSNE